MPTYPNSSKNPRIRSNAITRSGLAIDAIAHGRVAALAIDEVRGHLYWLEVKQTTHLGRIRRADLDGQNIEDVIAGLPFPAGTLPRSGGLVIDPYGNKLFWGQGEAVWWANLDGSSATVLKALDSGHIAGESQSVGQLIGRIGRMAVGIETGQVIEQLTVQLARPGQHQTGVDSMFRSYVAEITVTGDILDVTNSPPVTVVIDFVTGQSRFHQEVLPLVVAVLRGWGTTLLIVHPCATPQRQLGTLLEQAQAHWLTLTQTTIPFGENDDVQ